MNKRYAIVRVDNCPSKYEKGFNDYFVCDGRGKDTRLGVDKINCKKCNYGDTKEQLIRKVQTALQLCNKNRVEKCNQFYLVAEKIVEFLGVE